MKVLGLDIGTSTISAVVYHVNQGVLTAKTVKNDSFMPGESWEKIQDPTIIYEIAMASVHEMLTLHPDIQTIGVTGQMHGIVYLDAAGDPVSPLYIWQDDRGDLPCDETRTWASHLSRITGYEVATGYGMVTHYYNINHGLVPENAAVFCTIHDFLAMKLAGLSRPLTEPTNASSFGLFDGPNGCFDKAAMKASGIDDTLVPGLIENPCLGIGPLGLPVYAAIGDNQVSFLGATRGRTDVLLVNIGAGSQISVYSPAHIHTQTMETRPFPDGGWLLTGASLCGGRTYALLENFFRQTAKMVTGSEGSVYDAMARMLDSQPEPADQPRIITLFQGTRKEPSLRGSITGLSTENFTPLNFAYGVMYGMADELFEMYRGYLDLGGEPPAAMIGSGNGLRKNPHLCRIMEKTFGCPLILSENNEEAACGAAIYAAKHCR